MIYVNWRINCRKILIFFLLFFLLFFPSFFFLLFFLLSLKTQCGAGNYGDGEGGGCKNCIGKSSILKSFCCIHLQICCVYFTNNIFLIFRMLKIQLERSLKQEIPVVKVALPVFINQIKVKEYVYHAKQVRGVIQ